MPDQIIRAVLDGHAVRVVAAVTTETVAEMVGRHQAAETAAVALARGATAALLLATLTKGEERVTMQILGDGPLGSVTIDANGAGEVRGWVTHPNVALGARRIGAAVGKGVVSVLRDLGLREPYRGSAPLVSGEIDEDIEAYLTTSEQVESALGCMVLLTNGRIRAAGGVLVQCLPGGEVEVVEAARARLRRFQELVEGLEVDAAVWAAAAIGSPERLQILDRRPVLFRCPCSSERVTAALHLLGVDELRAMLREDGGAEVTCNFCSQRYALAADELSRLIQGLGRA